MKLENGLDDYVMRHLPTSPRPRFLDIAFIGSTGRMGGFYQRQNVDTEPVHSGILDVSREIKAHARSEMPLSRGGY